MMKLLALLLLIVNTFGQGEPPSTSEDPQTSGGDPGAAQQTLEFSFATQEKRKSTCTGFFRLFVWNPCPCKPPQQRRDDGGCAGFENCPRGEWEFAKWYCYRDVYHLTTTDFFKNIENVARIDACPWSEINHSCQLWFHGTRGGLFDPKRDGEIWRKGMCHTDRQINGVDTVGCVMEQLKIPQKDGNFIDVYWRCKDPTYGNVVPYNKPGFLTDNGPLPTFFQNILKIGAGVAVLSLFGGAWFVMRKKREAEYQPLVESVV